jgi:hypothetical protein
MNELIVTPESNAPSREDIIRQATEAGRATADGGDALPNLAKAVVLAASLGELSLVRSHGRADCDDAAAIYAAYAHARRKRARFDVCDDRRAQVSKLRQLIKMGLMTNTNPPAVIDNTIAVHLHALSNGHKVPSLYSAMVSIARRQLEAGRDLTRDEINVEICAGIKRPVPTLAAKLAKIDAALTEIITKAGDQSDEVIKARALIRRRIMVLRNSPLSSEPGDTIDLSPILEPVEVQA